MVACELPREVYVTGTDDINVSEVVPSVGFVVIISSSRPMPFNGPIV